MLKGSPCPSKISGAQLQPPSVLLNGLFTQKEQYLHIPGTHKKLPMASPVPHILASPVLPCLEREGPATPPGLSKSLGWLGPSCWSSRSRSLQVSMGPTSTGCSAPQLQVCSGVLLVLTSHRTTLTKLFESTWSAAPLRIPRSCLNAATQVCHKRHCQNVLRAALERLPSPSQLQSVCPLPIFSWKTSSSPSLCLN